MAHIPTQLAWLTWGGSQETEAATLDQIRSDQLLSRVQLFATP